MKRLIIVCEGPTEQEFCTEVLGVEFAKYDIYVEAPDQTLAWWYSALGYHQKANLESSSRR